MTNYNYLETMVEDIKDYIRNNPALDRNDLEYGREALEQKLHDDLWVNDSITGNASGSYTCNRYQAQQYVVDNIELLEEMCHEFGIEAKEIGKRFLNCDWEWMDVSIRCYLLSQAISEALDQIEEDLQKEE